MACPATTDTIKNLYQQLPALNSGQSSASMGASAPACSVACGAEWSAAPDALSLLHVHTGSPERVVYVMRQQTPRQQCRPHLPAASSWWPLTSVCADAPFSIFSCCSAGMGSPTT